MRLSFSFAELEKIRYGIELLAKVVWAQIETTRRSGDTEKSAA
jgi:hypothetical protein